MNGWDEIIYDLSKESNSEFDAYVIWSHRAQSMRSGSAAAT